MRTSLRALASALLAALAVGTMLGAILGTMAGTMLGQTQANCTFQTFNPPNGDIYGFYPNGINDRGVVVGQVWGPSQSMGNAFTRSPQGNITLFDVPNAAWTMFNRVNVYGASVGAYGSGSSSLPPGSGSNGLIHTLKSYATLNYPGSPSTELTGINQSNTIVGTELDPTTKGTWGFMYENGKFQQIRYPGSVQTTVNGINDKGVIVGGYEMGNFENPWSGFIFENGKFMSLSFVPSDINNEGTIVAGNQIRFKDGTTEIIYLSGSAGTSGSGINNRGIITGSASYGTFEFAGFTAECTE
jgi:hypothetical protein